MKPAPKWLVFQPDGFGMTDKLALFLDKFEIQELLTAYVHA